MADFLTRRTPRAIVHVLAVCTKCGWHDEEYRKAARRASAHVRTTGHTVDLEHAAAYSIRATAKEKHDE